MKTDWREFFNSCLKDPVLRNHDLARNMESIYQAFKARLIEELGVRGRVDTTKAGYTNTQLEDGVIYDKSQKDN